MPLHRVSDLPAIEPISTGDDAIRFVMSDGTRAVVCYVVQAAFANKAATNATSILKLFWEYRALIERAASANFDAGAVAADGSVVVDVGDLKSTVIAGG
jgi:hypothetical protein